MATPNSTVLATVVSPTLSLVMADSSGFAIMATCVGAPPITAGLFQVSCLILRTDVAGTFKNTGTTAVPVWTAF